jgi:hypothetical protein
VIERGFDENLEKGARCILPFVACIRACFWKILQGNFLNRRSSQCRNIKVFKTLSTLKHQIKATKKAARKQLL